VTTNDNLPIVNPAVPALIEAVDPGQARALFLAERLTGIGGSDAACVVGLNPYKLPLQLYLEKRGELAEADLSDNAAVRWGNLLEDVVADHFAETTGKSVRRNAELLRSEQWPWMIAHIDRELVDEDAILECKTAGSFVSKDEWGKTGTDQVPEHYLLQCQHYLAVTGRSRAYLAVLIGGRDFRTYILDRDQDLIEALAVEEGAFWQMCLDGKPPEVNYEHKAALNLMKRRYAKVDPSMLVQLSPEAVDAAAQFEWAKAEIKRLEAFKDSKQAQLLEAIGNGIYGILPNGSAFKRIEIKETYIEAFTRKGPIQLRKVKDWKI